MEKNIYLLYGPDRYLLEEYLKKIKKSFEKLETGINYILVSEENISELIGDIETPAFGYDKKLIIVKNSGLFKKDKKKSENPFVLTLSKYIEDNIDLFEKEVYLIFIEDNAEKNELYKQIEKNGKVQNFEEQKLPQLVTKVKNICKAYGVDIDDKTTVYFIECAGTNMNEIINEIRKLIEYTKKGGKITKDSIDLLTTKKVEAVIFDLTDNLGRKKISAALDVYHNLIYSKEPVQKILVMLYNHFKKLYIVKLAIKEKKQAINYLNLKPNQSFLVSKYTTQANSFSEEELNSLIQELALLDYKSKTGLLDIDIGLESILCNYCS